MSILSATEWDRFLENYPDAHILQTTAWGALKAAFGWEVVRVAVNGEAGWIGAQILFRRLPFGARLAYIPKGPVPICDEASFNRLDVSGWIKLFEEVDRICRQKRAIFLKVEPDLLQEQVEGIPNGFRDSPHSIQPPRSILVDLTGSEEELLARMKQKTRYNIRLAQKKGVKVEKSTDVNLFYRLMEITGGRDRFEVHSLAYYQRALALFGGRGSCRLLVAEYEGVPLAALIAFAHGERAWYFYGASSSEHRELMPAYLLQWEAMRWARDEMRRQYDLWGVPDVSEQELEAHFNQRSEGLWGVYRFKRGFGGKLTRTAGPWDRVYQPALYRLYLWWARRNGPQ
jgi:lipid II:glycine glycyltransferase (peptidoglycan interpeptide bridge formation enzyme)